MHFLATAALFFTLSLRTASSLGINCRGSAQCYLQEHIISGLMPFVASMNASVIYAPGAEIACLKLKHVVFELGGEDLHACMFLQSGKENTPTVSTAQGLFKGIAGDQARRLLERLHQHGCRGCGSIPVDFASNNQATAGILTVNFVHNAHGCNGTCRPSFVAQSNETFPVKTDVLIQKRKRHA